MDQRAFIDPPRRELLARFRPGFAPRFLVTVDTEEEFDWSRPLRRSGHSTDTVPALRKFQQFCAGFAVKPIYLVDYPVVDDPLAADLLHRFAADGEAEIGIQLHPWVNPPFDEEVTPFNSFAGNLPAPLERSKLMALRDRIEAATGRHPRIYRAGRYGVGLNTLAHLREARVSFDTSVRAMFDYGAEGGRDFRSFPAVPFWLDRPGGILELPLTTVYGGMLRRQGGMIYPRLWRAPRLRGVLSRLGLLERIALTPEGIAPDEAVRGIDMALDDGLPLLVFSFHSPSLQPGHTPYVRNDGDLDRFYDWWRAVFEHLLRRAVRPATLDDVAEAVMVAA